MRLQRSTTSQATQTDPVWSDSGWSDTGPHTFPKMKTKFYGKSAKNKGFAKWENEKPNPHPNMDIMEVQALEQLEDHNGTETRNERSSTEVIHSVFMHLNTCVNTMPKKKEAHLIIRCTVPHVLVSYTC